MRNETRKETEARRAKRQLKQTATERYSDHQNDIGALLDLIGEELRVHAEAAAKQPKNWGFAGDLANTRGTLKQILAGFLIGRYDWTETEAARFIEDHLEDMRQS